MAFILVQHLDPTHESMMVDLLASRTAMTVRQAADGMLIEREHLYIIPPGTYLSVGTGALHLTPPQARHGARLPFDFLLHSLAAEYGERAICVILSGTGADGSLGLKAVKENGGLVIAQDPDDAGYDGMPRNAITTGAVDLVLPVAKIPEALVKYDRRMTLASARNGLHEQNAATDWLPEIIELLRTKTVHDFTLYKPGTLQRRIERRMAMAAIETDDMDRYLAILRSDADELDQLAKDLLINVTSFFRDAKVFDLLAREDRPRPGPRPLVRQSDPRLDRRVQHGRGNLLPCHAVPGGNLGRATQRQAAGLRVRCRPGCRGDCPGWTLPGDNRGGCVAGPARPLLLEGRSRLSGRPRSARAVVFTVQDVLADPPFSRIDLVSCRNLLIYLRPEAQAKVISMFHFALREGGILLLGSSETAGDVDGRFELISKSERLYRHIGRSRPGRTWVPDETRRQRARAHAPGTRQRTLPPGHLRRSLPAAGDRVLRAGSGADQPQARVPVFPGTDRALSARGVRTRHARSACHGASGHADPAALGDPAGQSGEACASSSPAAR